MRLLPVFLLLLGFTGSATAQRASLSGFVRDAASGETLLLATVRLDGTPYGAATNNSGYYTLAGIEPGTYTVVASYIGFRDTRQEITLAPGEQRRLDIDLASAARELDEVVVTDDRAEEEIRRVGTAQISTDLIRQLPAVLEPDVFRSLQLLPGIKNISDFSSGLYIRGGSPDQTLILLDRTTVYNPTHFFGFFSTFNPDAIKDVRVYKGGYPAEYGGRLGSVVDIYNKDGNRQKLDGSATIGLLASRALIEGPYKKGSFMLSARRSTIEPLLAALQNADIDGLPEAFYFYDLNGKLNFDASENDRFSLAFYAGRDYVRVPFLTDEETGEATAQIDLAYGNTTGSLNWTHLFSNTLFSNFTFTASRYYSKPTFFFAETEFAQRTRITDLSAKGDIEWIPNARHELKVGAWAGRFGLTYRRAFDGEVNFDPQIEAWYASAYAQERFKPSPLWTLEAGVRAQYFGDGGYARFEPRASVEHRPMGSDDVRVQLGYGRYYQFLTLITSEVFSGADFWLTAADGVPPSYGDQFVLGVKTRPTASLNVDVEGYYRTMRGLFEIDPFLQDPAGLDYPAFFRFGDGYAWGVEAQVEGRVGRVSGLAAYTYSTTRRRFPDFPNPAPDDFFWYPPKYDRTNDANIVVAYDLSRAWRATSVFTYGTGQAYTEPYAQYRLTESPFTSTDTNVLQSQYNASRLPAYHRLDVGVTRRGRFFGFADYELQLQVINAYSRKNAWFYFLQFERDNTVKRTRANQIPIPIPNVSLTLNF